MPDRSSRGSVGARRPRVASVALLCAGLMMGWCVAGCALFRTNPRRDLANATPYPSHLRQGETLDIQVIREGTKIRLTNTTARPYGASRIWINRWFSHPLDGLEVGEEVTLSLYDFRDEFGDAFRGGGFFATEDPDAVVRAQLEMMEVDEEGSLERRLLGLVVVEGGGVGF